MHILTLIAESTESRRQSLLRLLGLKPAEAVTLRLLSGRKRRRLTCSLRLSEVLFFPARPLEPALSSASGDSPAAIEMQCQWFA